MQIFRFSRSRTVSKMQFYRFSRSQKCKFSGVPDLKQFPGSSCRVVPLPLSGPVAHACTVFSRQGESGDRPMIGLWWVYDGNDDEWKRQITRKILHAHTYHALMIEMMMIDLYVLMMNDNNGDFESIKGKWECLSILVKPHLKHWPCPCSSRLAYFFC